MLSVAVSPPARTFRAIASAVALGGAACTSSVGDKPLAEGGPSGAVRQDSLVASRVVTSDQFARLSQVTVLGDQAWVLDRQSEPFFHVIDLSSGALVRSVGRSGEGPGEFRRIGTIGRISRDSLGVYDEGSRRLLRVSASDDDWVTSPTTTVQSFGNAVLVSAVPLGRDGWLAKTTSATGTYVVVSTQGELRREITIPFVGPVEAPIDDRAIATMQSNDCVSPDGRQVALTFVSASRIDVYDIETGARTEVAVPDPTDATWVDVDGRLVRNDSTSYYTDCAFTDRSILALYNGRNVRRGGRPYDVSAREVHVFNRAGGLTAIWSLDRGLNRIAVDDNRTHLVGTNAADATVIMFPLPADGEW